MKIIEKNVTSSNDGMMDEAQAFDKDLRGKLGSKNKKRKSTKVRSYRDMYDLVMKPVTEEGVVQAFQKMMPVIKTYYRCSKCQSWKTEVKMEMEKHNKDHESLECANDEIIMENISHRDDSIRDEENKYMVES